MTPVTTKKEKRKNLRSDRKCFRIKTEFPCEVGPAGGSMIAAQILDLSYGGLKFSCDLQTIKAIFPQDQAAVGMILDAEIEVHFRLPTESKRATAIKARVRVVHSERLAQDLFNVGVQFLGLNQTATKKLEDFLDKSQPG